MARQPPIFVINLDRDAQRLSSISKQLSEQELEFCRFPAISGLDVPSLLQTFFVTDEKDPPLTSGEVGCYASHLSLHKKICEEIKEPCLILEDDVKLLIDLGPLFAAVQDIPRDWDVIRLSNAPKRPVLALDTLAEGRRVVKYSVVPNGTGAYLITPQGAQKFLKWKNVRTKPLDQDMRRIWDCGLTTLGIVPPPIRPDIFESTIDKLGRNLKRKRRQKRTNFFSKARDAINQTSYNVKSFGFTNWLLLLCASLTKRALKRLRIQETP